MLNPKNLDNINNLNPLILENPNTLTLNANVKPYIQNLEC